MTFYDWLACPLFAAIFYSEAWFTIQSVVIDKRSMSEAELDVMKAFCLSMGCVITLDYSVRRFSAAFEARDPSLSGVPLWLCVQVAAAVVAVFVVPAICRQAWRWARYGRKRPIDVDEKGRVVMTTGRTWRPVPFWVRLCLGAACLLSAAAFMPVLHAASDLLHA
ncbi:hypothetical protein [Bifidobacterium tibiigranuli]|uniref:Uncharacterized protein n=1 Tax=Bifidobacterium tibiigranuli TaxID=2172043 RepID=A0A5N6S511_9BIFI|nr:hypothetical protein [Bifidobacterium tibiigranuli]KAE8128728.1 hypothetical protein DDE84_04500 [Bifidobacterium tibiigranuli]KAE8128919.1 hypothetical protein DDF78_04290 [Bifidobacterium tibiigranuli]